MYLLEASRKRLTSFLQEGVLFQKISLQFLLGQFPSCGVVSSYCISLASRNPLGEGEGGGSKIYCYPNIYCYANLSILLDQTFKGEGESLSGEVNDSGGEGTPCGRKPVPFVSWICCARFLSDILFSEGVFSKFV